MSRKDELRQIIDAARSELIIIEEKERDEKRKDLIGRCYESKKRNTFYRIAGLDENSYLKLLTFTYYDNNTLGAYYDYMEEPYFLDEGDIKEITQQQFYGQWLIFLTKINMISF